LFIFELGLGVGGVGRGFLVKLVTYGKWGRVENLANVADRLNQHFRSGGLAYEVLDEIRAFPKPILVDFDNTLCDRVQGEYVLNPDAPMLISSLDEMGCSVFIVTNTRTAFWESVADFLVANYLWLPTMTLMTLECYLFLTIHRSHEDKRLGFGEKLVNDYVDFRGWQGRLSPESLIKVPGYKCLAPIWKKPFDIPWIDDGAVEDNPGMLAIKVPWWELEPTPFPNPTNHTFEEAVEIVRRHYAEVEATLT